MALDLIILLNIVIQIIACDKKQIILDIYTESERKYYQHSWIYFSAKLR